MFRAGANIWRIDRASTAINLIELLAKIVSQIRHGADRLPFSLHPKMDALVNETSLAPSQISDNIALFQKIAFPDNDLLRRLEQIGDRKLIVIPDFHIRDQRIIIVTFCNIRNNTRAAGSEGNALIGADVNSVMGCPARSGTRSAVDASNPFDFMKMEDWVDHKVLGRILVKSDQIEKRVFFARHSQNGAEDNKQAGFA